MTEAPRKFAPLVDPGWLFLLAGLAILAATVIVPAQMDLRKARWLRDRALAVEAHRQQRLERYREYLSAIENKEPSLVLSLAASQLNMIPADREAIPGSAHPLRDASVFPALEPPALELPEYHAVDSLLVRWTTDDHKRLWLIGAGALCVLVGLLPPSRGWGSYERKHPYLDPSRA